jgi:nucleoside-diphosphate-sugar epimerase
LLSDENLWLKEFLHLLALETGLTAPRIRLPWPVVGIIGCGGELFDLLNRRSPTARVCVETALQAQCTQFFSNAKAREELGWKPVGSIQESIAEAVSWFRSEPEIELAPLSSVESHVR